MNKSTRKLVISGLLLAVGLVLPFLTANLGSLGQLISPLHIPAFIAGLTCGAGWGIAVGAVLPILRSLIFGMPPLVPVAIPMAFELAVYAAVCGLVYPALLKKGKDHLPAMIIALLIAMVAGRLVGGAAKAAVMGLTGKGYSFQTFVSAYFAGTWVGALIHLVLVPAITLALEKSRLSPMTDR